MTNVQTGRPPLLVLVGPTAVGKTDISLRIARALDCEIVSGDSMQVYRGMDIGTAKLPVSERQGIPHHLIDICDPDQPFSVTEFQRLCRETIADIHGRGKLPFIVGGTGLYVESVVYGFRFRDVPADEPFREECRRIAAERGSEALHRMLADADPAAAARIHPNDERRVIRALEIRRAEGSTAEPASAPNAEQRRDDVKTSPYDLCLIGIDMDRAALYERINARVDAMLTAGLVDEVRRLLEAGVPRSAVSMQGLGYKEIAAYLAGETDYASAVEQLKMDTRRFAKRQLSWFRYMQGLEWVVNDGDAKNNELFREICAIIAGKFPIDLEYICS